MTRWARRGSAHSFLGIDQDGATAIVRTSGNPHAHVVLRGGRAKTNYDAESIRAAEEKLISEKLPPVLMVDCSHANSEKKFAKQEDVWHSVIRQRIEGTKSLIGMMVESHLHEGNQPISTNAKDLKYGVSITDSCIGWETTERMLRWGYEALGKAVSHATCDRIRFSPANSTNPSPFYGEGFYFFKTYSGRRAKRDCTLNVYLPLNAGFWAAVMVRVS